jgi:hypothetical protein
VVQKHWGICTTPLFFTPHSPHPPTQKKGGSNIHVKVFEKKFWDNFSPRKHDPSFCGEPKLKKNLGYKKV